MIERIPVASTVASGEYEMGFQQVAELLPVPGVTFVGKIPESLQSVTRYSAGIPRNAEHPERAKALLAYLSSSAAQPVVRSTGLDSIPASLAGMLRTSRSSSSAAGVSVRPRRLIRPTLRSTCGSSSGTALRIG